MKGASRYDCQSLMVLTSFLLFWLVHFISSFKWYVVISSFFVVRRYLDSSFLLDVGVRLSCLQINDGNSCSLFETVHGTLIWLVLLLDWIKHRPFFVHGTLFVTLISCCRKSKRALIVSWRLSNLALLVVNICFVISCIEWSILTVGRQRFPCTTDRFCTRRPLWIRLYIPAAH